MRQVNNPFKQWSIKQWLIRVPMLIIGYIVVINLYTHTLGDNAPIYWLVRSRLQQIEVPASWDLVEEKGEGGRFGVFCPFLGGGLCPYYSEKYSIDRSEEEPLIETMEKLALNSGFNELHKRADANCRDAVVRSNCEVQFIDNKYLLSVYFLTEGGSSPQRLTLDITRAPR